jgi:hypothetical protein
MNSINKNNFWSLAGLVILGSAYLTTHFLAVHVLRELGYGKLGFYSLSVLYCSFGVTSFVSKTVVRKLGARLSLTVGSLCHCVYVSTFILPAYKKERPGELTVSDTCITLIILVAACINGFGAAILWVAKG